MPFGAALCLTPLLLAAPAAPQEVARYVGSVRFSVDTSLAFPGGVLVARLQSRRGLGTAYAILDGRRSAFYSSPRGLRALVPVPVTTVAGKTTVGFELMARQGRQRIPLDLTLAPRSYPPRILTIPEALRGLLVQASVVRDGRELLALVRTESRSPSPGPLKPPVTIAEGIGFGGATTWVGGQPVEPLFDASYGDDHRGVDYEVPVGTAVLAPGAGVVVYAGPMALGGLTLVIDHGQGVMSVLFHLSRVDVQPGDPVAARAIVGLSGQTGLALVPLLQWRVYVHGIAVDPRALDRSLD
jgi:hypothetical protein